MWLILVLCSLLYVSFRQASALQKVNSVENLGLNTFEHCDFWAKQNECVTNPTVMWKTCATSCFEYAKDDNVKCKWWAETGECTNNPRYIQVHCPKACGYSMGWNSVVRYNLSVYDHEVTNQPVVEKCRVPKDILSAAAILKKRLHSYVNGHRVTEGIVTLYTMSDNEYHFLHMVGLSEGFIYTLRLYEIIFQYFNEKTLLDKNLMRIERVYSAVSSEDTDRMFREAYGWLALLDDGYKDADDLIKHQDSINPSDIGQSGHIKSPQIKSSASPTPFNPIIDDKLFQHSLLDNLTIDKHCTPYTAPDLYYIPKYLFIGCAGPEGCVEGIDIYSGQKYSTDAYGYASFDQRGGAQGGGGGYGDLYGQDLDYYADDYYLEQQPHINNPQMPHNMHRNHMHHVGGIGGDGGGLGFGLGNLFGTSGNKKTDKKIDKRKAALAEQLLREQETISNRDMNTGTNKHNTVGGNGGMHRGTSGVDTHYTIEHTTLLYNGISMPMLGLGTYNLQGEIVIDTVIHALEIGYRLLDLGQTLSDDISIGKAIQIAIERNIIESRTELFIVHKITNASVVYTNNTETLTALIQSQLDVLNISYFDLYLMDLPLANSTVQLTVYNALEVILKLGLIKSIGIANCDLPLLYTVLSTAKTVPHVVQNKIDIYHIGKVLDTDPSLLDSILYGGAGLGSGYIGVTESLLDITALYGIALMGYAPLSGYPYTLRPVDDPIVRYIAAHHIHTPTSHTRHNNTTSNGGNSGNTVSSNIDGMSTGTDDVGTFSSDLYAYDALETQLFGSSTVTYNGTTTTRNRHSNYTTHTNSTLNTLNSSTTDYLHKSVPDEDYLTDYYMHTLKHSVTTPAQVLLRWSLQNYFITLTQSTNKEKLLENYNSLFMNPLNYKELTLLGSIQHLSASPLNKPVYV